MRHKGRCVTKADAWQVYSLHNLAVAIEVHTIDHYLIFDAFLFAVVPPRKEKKPWVQSTGFFS
jgi:hypothetical protein